MLVGMLAAASTIDELGTKGRIDDAGRMVCSMAISKIARTGGKVRQDFLDCCFTIGVFQVWISIRLPGKTQSFQGLFLHFEHLRLLRCTWALVCECCPRPSDVFRLPEMLEKSLKGCVWYDSNSKNHNNSNSDTENANSSDDENSTESNSSNNNSNNNQPPQQQQQQQQHH